VLVVTHEERVRARPPASCTSRRASCDDARPRPPLDRAGGAPGRPPRHALNGAAACVGAAALVFFLALGIGVSRAAQRMFPADARLVEVIPGNVALGGVLGGGKLDDEALARMEALPGATAVWPRVSLRVPIAAPGPPRGLDYNWPPGMTLQLPVVGVAPELVAGDVGPGLAFQDPGPAADGPIPVLLSRRLIEIYNKTIAPAWACAASPPASRWSGSSCR
jgi:hypothetical protein